MRTHLALITPTVYVRYIGITMIVSLSLSCSEHNVNSKPDPSDGDPDENIIEEFDDSDDSEQPEEQAPDIIVSPTAINYGIVFEGTSATDVFSVGNVGDGELLVDMIEITTGNQAGHSITLSEPLPWRLEPGEYREVITTYLSHDADIHYGEVRIVSTDPDEMISTVSLINEPYMLPEETLSDCEGVADVELNHELMSLSWDSSMAEGNVYVETEGTYHVYSNYIAESGSSQTNESAYIRISNSTNPDGFPMFSNCNTDWVVADLDNGMAIPSGMVAYVGTFYLAQGDNAITMGHYCPLYRAGECPSFHIEIDSSSTCDTGNPNSVHFTGTAVCLLPAE